MENWHIDDSVLAELPIFPLEKAHLFPGAVLPLHIFEPRYVEMLQDTPRFRQKHNRHRRDLTWRGAGSGCCARRGADHGCRCSLCS